MERSDAIDIICLMFALITALSILYSEGSDVIQRIPHMVFFSLFCFIPYLFKRAGIMTLPISFVLLIELSMFMHMIGLQMGFYDDLEHWDTLTHLLSSVTVSFCVLYALIVVDSLHPKIHFSRRLMPLFLFMVVMTFGLFWEFIEYHSDLYLGSKMQYSPFDTISDLGFDLLGVALVSVYAYWLQGNRDMDQWVRSLELHPVVKRIGTSG